jgi:hypothetical protein
MKRFPVGTGGIGKLVAALRSIPQKIRNPKYCNNVQGLLHAVAIQES